MAVIPEAIWTMGFLAFLFPWRLNIEPGTDTSIIANKENPKTKSLYDLLAHFPVDKNIICPERDVHMPFPGDCTRYITCRNYKAHIRGCPPGMRFDKQVLRCRFAFQTTCNETLDADQQCAQNEVFMDCHRGCEETCPTYRDDYEDCPEECSSGCFCQENLVRGPQRNCIPRHKCDTSNRLEPWFLINSHGKSLQHR